MPDNHNKPSYIWSVLTNKCPRCRKGYIYKEKNSYKLKSVVKMEPACPVCGQPTDIEVGFYYGTGFVSYGLSVAVCVASLILWWLTIGFSLDDSRFFWWMGLNAVLLIVIQPPLMRLSRTMWLSWFVKYDPDWKDHPINKESHERIVPEQMGNW